MGPARAILPVVVALLFFDCGFAARAFDDSAATIDFPDFHSIRMLSLVGNAAVSGTALRLTPARRDQAGAAWSHEKQAVRSGFETTFQFQLTGQGGICNGADGFAFVLQNSGPKELGGRGSAGGFGVADPANPRHKGIPWSVAVFFDTCRNPEQGDPSSNYLAVRTYGKPAEMRWPAERLAFTRHLRIHLKDGKPHTARIAFRAPVLSVALDGATALETPVDLAIVVDSQGGAWVGFTASTGAGYQNHDILNWSFRSENVSSTIAAVSSEISFPMSSCLPGRNLCTPEQAFVEPRAAGYHVVLPANLEWGVSIPNPSERSAVVTNARGFVCWDAKARGSDGCSGPAGNGAAAGTGFLAEDTPAGALISRMRGHETWFSVNGRQGAGFQENEGFFEFDLEFK